MAKAKAKAKQGRVIALQLPPDNNEIGTADLEEGEDEGQQELDAIAELRGMGASTDYRYSVSRVSSKPGEQQGYCATYSAGDLSLDAIRENFGGGKYRIRVTDSSGKYITLRTVDIVALPKPLNAPAAQAPGMDMSGMAEVIAALRPNAPPAAGSDNTMQLMLAMIKNQGDLLQAMLTRPAPEGPKITDILAIIKENQPRRDPEESAVSLLLKGLELGRGLGEKAETGMLDVARDGLDILGNLIARDRGQPPAAVPAGARVALPAPSATTTAAPARPAQPSGDPMMRKLQWLRAQLASLILQAARDKDPELYATVMLDNLPDFFTDEEILARLQAPDAVSQLSMLDPRVSQHAAWFEEFRKHCVTILTEEEEPEIHGGAPSDAGGPGGGDFGGDGA